LYDVVRTYKNQAHDGNIFDDNRTVWYFVRGFDELPDTLQDIEANAWVNVSLLGYLRKQLKVFDKKFRIGQPQVTLIFWPDSYRSEGLFPFVSSLCYELRTTNHTILMITDSVDLVEQFQKQVGPFLAPVVIMFCSIPVSLTQFRQLISSLPRRKKVKRWIVPGMSDQPKQLPQDFVTATIAAKLFDVVHFGKVSNKDPDLNKARETFPKVNPIRWRDLNENVEFQSKFYEKVLKKAQSLTTQYNGKEVYMIHANPGSGVTTLLRRLVCTRSY